MIAVIFEVTPRPDAQDAYLDLAADLRPVLEQVDGFISIERFRSLADDRKLLSLSFWRDEETVRAWRTMERHRQVQIMGRASVFEDYRLTVAEIVRVYGMSDREQTPEDSQAFHRGNGRP